MRVPESAARPLAAIAGLFLAFAGLVSTPGAANAVPGTRAAMTHAAPTMTYCELKVRAKASTSAKNLSTLHNRNGKCPGGSGYDTIRCWAHDCRDRVHNGAYRCKSGGKRHNTWTPVVHSGRKAWIAHACAGYSGP